MIIIFRNPNYTRLLPSPACKSANHPVRNFLRSALASLFLSLAALFTPVDAPAFQHSQDAPQIVTIAPDTQYRSGEIHKLFFGAHWRDLWGTPIEVEVLDLDEFAGGLTPTKRGGGMQTLSLRLKGADGREYKFRSVRKDPTKVLPEEMRESIAADILQDQISSSNPLAPVIVAPLLNAVGVLNARPELVWMPNTSKLGEFRSDFGGVLGTIEENPNDFDDESASFGGADKVVGAMKFLRKLEDDNDECTDAAAYVKARLMDVFLGDWDRHLEQWKWAGYKSPGGVRRWKPIPRDRDQAFARFDGLFPWIASIGIPQLEGFGNDYPEIEDLTWSGRFGDRRFLSSAGWPVWDSITTYLQASLTNEVIENAVRLLPPPMYTLEGEALVAALKARRDLLPDAAREFYELCAEYPDIYTSDKREYAEVTYLDGGRVDVAVFKRDKNSGDKKGKPFYHRTFLDDETHEIRLHLHGGDDFVKVTGERTASTAVVIASGGGDDEIVDESTGGGLGDSFPFSIFTTPAVSVFDEDPATRRSTLSRIRFDDSPRRKPADDLEKYEPAVRDYGYDWKFAPWYGLNPDEGLFVGGGPILYKHGFRVEPYVYRMQLRGGYATEPGRYRLDFTGDFYTVVPGKRLNLVAEFSQIDLLNYFGDGPSRLVFNDSLLEAGYYRARSQHVLFAPTLFLDMSEASWFTVGLGLKRFKPDPEAGTVLTTLAPVGSDRPSWYGSIHLGATFDSRDIPSAARNGLLGVVKYSAHHPMTGGFRNFQRLSGEVRAYITPENFAGTIALRAGGERLWGVYPFYEAAFLGGGSTAATGGSGTGTSLGAVMAASGGAATGPFGGPGTLRGYEKQRFAGRGSLFGAAEVRAELGSIMLLVPIDWGVAVSVESGWVYYPGVKFKNWHNAMGGTIWFAFIGPENVLSITLMGSPERTGVIVTGGYAF